MNLIIGASLARIEGYLDFINHVGQVLRAFACH